MVEVIVDSISNKNIIWWTGASFIAMAAFYTIYEFMPLTFKIRKHIKSLIPTHDDRPIIEHILSREYGKRVFIKLPDGIKYNEISNRRETLEYYLRCEVVLIPLEKDLIIADIIKRRDRYKEEVKRAYEQ